LINLNYQDAILSGAGRWNVAFNNLTAFLQGEGGDLIFSLSSFLPYYLMLLTTFITLLSLARYLFTNYKIFTGPIPIIRPKKTSLKHP